MSDERFEQQSPQDNNGKPNGGQYNAQNPNGSYPPPFYNNPYGQYTPFQGPTNEQNTEYKWNFEEYAAAGTQKKPHRNRGFAIFASLLGIVLAVGVLWLSGYGVYTLLNEGSEAPISSQVPQPQNNVAQITIKDKPDDVETNMTATQEGFTTVDIAKRVRPSVVGITQYNSYNSFTASGSGSGIVISSDGYIVTNAHVVEGAIGINVELYNGESYSAQVIGYDSRTDLAVIKVPAENLSFAEFGDSTKLEVGEKVIAIGNPGGQVLAGSVTQGIVSGLDRVIRDAGFTVNFIQVDAAINPGNSGGALVNGFGQVVGINSAKIASVEYEGIGFAIPIHEAKPIIDDLMVNGYVTGRTKIGISGAAVDEVVAQINGVPAGILIYTVDVNSDLANKKVARGDIITHINGERVLQMEDISRHLEGKKPGDTIELSLYRQDRMGSGRQYDVTVKLMADVEKPTMLQK